MPKWHPDTAGIEENEILGRRVFGKGVGGKDQVDADAFEDSRLEDDLSLDRLGCPNVDKSAVRYLTPICDAAAATRRLDFQGWASIRYKKIKKTVQALPDPIVASSTDAANPYHAVASREQARQRIQSIWFSRNLFYCFSQDGEFVLPQRTSA